MGGPAAPHGLLPMQAAGALNRPISLQPFGQVPFRAVCGVAALVHSRAMDGALRLASHPEKTLVQLQKDIEHVLSAADHYRKLGHFFQPCSLLAGGNRALPPAHRRESPSSHLPPTRLFSARKSSRHLVGLRISNREEKHRRKMMVPKAGWDVRCWPTVRVRLRKSHHCKRCIAIHGAGQQYAYSQLAI